MAQAVKQRAVVHVLTMAALAVGNTVMAPVRNHRGDENEVHTFRFGFCVRHSCVSAETHCEDN
jgi:hypothetical protein